MEEKKHFWILEGLIFGILLFIFTTIIELISHDFQWEGLGIKAIVWLIGGLAYGFTMKWVRRWNS